VERHLGVHLDHPRVALRVLLDLEDAPPERVRLRGHRLARQLRGDATRVGVRRRLEHFADRRREHARRSFPDEAPCFLVGCAGARGRKPDRNVDADDLRIDEQRVGERVAAECVDDGECLRARRRRARRARSAPAGRRAGRRSVSVTTFPSGSEVGGQSVARLPGDPRSCVNCPRVRSGEVVHDEAQRAFQREVDTHCLGGERCTSNASR
jgi:hypothetical protein